MHGSGMHNIGRFATDEANTIYGIRENNKRYAATYNIYYATSPTVALPPTPGPTQTGVDVGAAGEPVLPDGDRRRVGGGEQLGRGRL